MANLMLRTLKTLDRIWRKNDLSDVKRQETEYNYSIKLTLMGLTDLLYSMDSYPECGHAS